MLRTASGRIDPRHRKPANYSDVLPIGRLLYKSPIIAFLYEPGMSVKEIRERESSTWHWYPWKHIQYDTLGEGELVERECVPDDSLDDLPEDLFTRNCNLIELRGLQCAHSLSCLPVCLSFSLQRSNANMVRCCCTSWGPFTFSRCWPSSATITFCHPSSAFARICKSQRYTPRIFTSDPQFELKLTPKCCP